MKTELIVGQKYNLKYTGNFCHIVGSEGNKSFGDKEIIKECVFVGLINTDVGERQVFYIPKNHVRMYIMFSSENNKHIVKEKIITPTYSEKEVKKTVKKLIYEIHGKQGKNKKRNSSFNFKR